MQAKWKKQLAPEREPCRRYVVFYNIHRTIHKNDNKQTPFAPRIGTASAEPGANSEL